MVTHSPRRTSREIPYWGGHAAGSKMTPRTPQGTGMKKIVWAAALVAGLGGCAHYQKKLDTWVGQPVGALVQSWGPPQSSYNLPDGSQVIQYAQRGNMVLPGTTYTTPQTTYQQGTVNAYGSNGGYATANYTGTSTTYQQRSTPATLIATSCTTNFTVNSSGYISAWSYNGNNCW